jgi:hypothetical protein
MKNKDVTIEMRVNISDTKVVYKDHKERIENSENSLLELSNYTFVPGSDIQIIAHSHDENQNKLIISLTKQETRTLINILKSYL